MKKGEEKCPCKDDSLALRDRMLGADGIIFASPVYVHTVSALMKNFYENGLPVVKSSIAKFLVKRKVRKILHSNGLDIAPEKALDAGNPAGI